MKFEITNSNLLVTVCNITSHFESQVSPWKIHSWHSFGLRLCHTHYFANTFECSKLCSFLLRDSNKFPKGKQHSTCSVRFNVMKIFRLLWLSDSDSDKFRCCSRKLVNYCDEISSLFPPGRVTPWTPEVCLYVNRLQRLSHSSKIPSR